MSYLAFFHLYYVIYDTLKIFAQETESGARIKDKFY